MKISLVAKGYSNNSIFDLGNSKVNRDNCVYSIWLLKQRLKAYGIDLSTCDLNSPMESGMVICFDLPECQVNNELLFLIIFESEVIKPKSWVLSEHESFKRVFTWNDELVDNKKYFKVNFAHKFPDSNAEYRQSLLPYSEKKLCTLIAGNKNVKHKLELYSERIKTIRWFEQNASDDFDLYGIGWDKYVPSNRYFRIVLRNLSFLNKIPALRYPSYQGAVDSKYDTLKKYKFAICYENAQMISGYITEKIFDCFFAGCVPVYWGAPNVTDHIPENCFIDRRQFKSHEKLYAYLTNMTELDYLGIQKNIENYLFSSKSEAYRAEVFADTIVEHVLKDLKGKFLI